ARAAVDSEDAIRYQLDVLVVVKFVRAEHQAIRTAGALEVSFRQRWPLVGQMRLVIDEGDTPAKTVLAQRGRDLKTRVAGADDQNWSLRHVSGHSHAQRQAVEPAKRVVQPPP